MRLGCPRHDSNLRLPHGVTSCPWLSNRPFIDVELATELCQGHILDDGGDPRRLHAARPSCLRPAQISGHGPAVDLESGYNQPLCLKPR
jgi:hypothetical protein